MDGFSDTLLRWWPIIAFGGMMGWWVSKNISDLKAHNDKQDARLDEHSGKIAALWDSYNDLIRRRLDKLEHLEEKDK